ncbi:hypothetical protein G6F62_000892 [Rhizopus arrhizus]|nr:hypothetical protein G6F24_006254 [Rhizopus arrhizus]KAG0911695.1 hypothetical protein G6F33_006759 [Rhizopus arrhizus]KAG1293655.1 hypothetical protein G6F66_005894 [Rhizopus arrhizus]KAG1358230.1 hypothetical protein G6F62_000892 [Rhizopus arrhizus]KAG1381400.1 hypothetical protein G6F61_003199 [Rhizopus arrhizus]
MSHLRRIEELIDSFHESTLENGPSAKNMGDTKEIAVELGSEIMNYVASKDIDYVCSLLFNSEKGIIRFLRSFAVSRDYNIMSAQANILGFLATFIKKAKSSLQIYAIDLEACCIQVATIGSARARIAAIDVLIAMLDTRVSQLDVSVMKISDLYRRFSDMYTLPPTRISASVKAKVIELLGTIARFYPNALKEHDPYSLKRWCLDSLEHILANKTNENAFIPGAINCLNSILFFKACNLIEPESTDSDRLFNILLKLIYLPSDASRYSDTIAALELFATHTYLFKNLILPNCEKLHRDLQTCSTHQNRLLFKYGTFAYDKFLITLADILCKNIDGLREKALFLFFVDNFMEALELGDDLEHFYRTSTAIRGIGYFSKACALIMSKDEMDKLCKELVKKSSWFYSDMNSDQYEYLRHLPSFLRAYSSFAGQLDYVSVELMSSLYHMCDIFILNFVRMSGYHRAQGMVAITNLLEMLYQKGESVLRKFLNNFFAKALLYTCTDIEVLGKGIRHAYSDLLYFWETLLTKRQDYKPFLSMASSQPEDNTEDQTEYNLGNEDNLSMDNSSEINHIPSSTLLQILYDTFMSSVIQMVGMFNLKLKNSDGEEGSDEDETSLKIVTSTLYPVNQKDFVLFQNFVEFWCMLMKKLENERLSDWTYILGTLLIDQSVRHPLVSGFYKMISEILISAEKRHMFDVCKNYYAEQNLMLESGKQIKPDNYASYMMFREFVKEVWHKLQQFTDDLLASCLRLVLAYPIAFFDSSELIAPLEKALHLGITFNSLAVIAMNILDKFLDPNSEHKIDDNFLSRILPCINEYLLIGVISSNENESDSGLSNLKKKPYKVPTAAQRRLEAVHKSPTESELGVTASEYSSLQELQLRMMRFLGRLGGKNKQLLMKQEGSEQNDDMLAWDPEKRLKIYLPFQNTKVDIYLDEFLPRICELAESSPDRQVKVAACELLHSLIIFMIGNSALQVKDTKESRESNYHKFYLRLFPIMLRLAIDPDQVARDMYRLLNSQVIHWFTNNAHYENPETTALLQACLKAACNSDASLRDYGAECIQEFVKWSIKQTSRSTDGAQNIKSLLKRLYNLMSHPSAIQRFGAALVFNRIYRLFREEATLVNEYTIELLGQLLLSLKLAHSDHPSIGTKDQAVEAISHIKRIIRKKISLFLETSPIRRPFIGSGEMKDLPSVVLWTFCESAKPQRTYAKTCINFFTEFVTMLPGVKSRKQWLTNNMDKDHSFLTDIFETDRLKPPSVLDSKVKMMTSYTSWISQMQVTIDGYIWLIERDIIDHMDLLTQPSSMLLDALSYYIRNTPQDALEEELEESLIEKSRIHSLYCHISVRIVYFFDLLFRSAEKGFDCYRYINNNTSDVLLHPKFTNLVANILVLPKKMSEKIEANHDYAITNSSISEIFAIAKHFILTAKENAALALVDKIVESTAQMILSKGISLVTNMEPNQGRLSPVDMAETTNAIKFMQSINLLDLICQKAHQVDEKHPETVNNYCETLFDQFLELCNTTSEPLWIKLFGEMVNIALNQPGIAAKKALNLLGFSGTRQGLSDVEKLSILQKYGVYIFDCIAYNFPAFATVFISNISQSLVADYLLIILGYFKENRISHRKAVASITDYFIEYPLLLNEMVSKWKTQEQMLNLIECLKLLFGADPGIISRSRGKPIVKLLYEAFLQFLDKAHSHSVISASLDLIPVYITMEESFLDQMSRRLFNSVISQFPAKSADIPKGSNLYNNYIAILDKLLNIMATFKSVLIFKLLKGVFVQEENHIYEQVIRESIAKFAKNLGLSSFLEVAQSCFDQYKDSSIMITHRQNLIKLIIFMLPLVDIKHVSAFYEKNITFIMDAIMRPPLQRGYAEQLIVDLKERASCFKLMQISFLL